MINKDLPNKIKVGNKYIGEGEPVFFIAEIGNNHNGDYYLAKKSIEEAIRAGADAVKLQKRSVADVFTKELLNKEQTKDQIYGKTYGEYRQHLELKDEDIIKLKEFAESLDSILFVTPFDHKSADVLEQMAMDLYKISSFDVTNLPLLEHVAKKGKPMILSVGMSDWDEIDEAVEVVLKHNNQLILKHCVSVYPTPDEKINLKNMVKLMECYRPLPVGYSGHERDILPTLASIALGAKTIERHFTLDKKLPGPDHATVSIEPAEFKQMVESARRIEQSLGDGLSKLLEDEMRARDKHSKSIVSAVDIKAGTPITAEMLTIKSPGYGLKPKMLTEVIGKTAKADIEADSVITKELINW